MDWKTSMARLWQAGLTISLALIMSLAFVNSHVSAEPTREALTREDGQSGVQITLTYLNPLKGLDEKELVFDVRMNTHTVDLNVYDFEKVLVLRDDKGNLYQAQGAEGLKGGGHHRGGVVKFSGTREDGSRIVQGARYFEILVKGVAGVPERVLRWDLPIE